MIDASKISKKNIITQMLSIKYHQKMGVAFCNLLI